MTDDATTEPATRNAATAEPLTPARKQPCPNCPPLVVPRGGYTPSRPSCIECCEKHLGAAYVLLTELNDIADDLGTQPGNFSRRLRAIGHLFEAEDESQQWPKLHAAIRAARRAYQSTGVMPDWNSLAGLATTRG